MCSGVRGPLEAVRRHCCCGLGVCGRVASDHAKNYRDKGYEVDQRAEDPHEGAGGDLVVEGGDGEEARGGGVGRVEDAAAECEEGGEGGVDEVSGE